MAKNTKTVLAIPAVDTGGQWFGDPDYRGGVDYRYGWNVDVESHNYVVVFREGVRTRVRTVPRYVDKDKGKV